MLKPTFSPATRRSTIALIASVMAVFWSIVTSSTACRRSSEAHVLCDLYGLFYQGLMGSRTPWFDGYRVSEVKFSICFCVQGSVVRIQGWFSDFLSSRLRHFVKATPKDNLCRKIFLVLSAPCVICGFLGNLSSDVFFISDCGIVRTVFLRGINGFAIVSQRPVQLSARPIYQPIRFPEDVLVKAWFWEPTSCDLCNPVIFFGVSPR